MFWRLLSTICGLPCIKNGINLKHQPDAISSSSLYLKGPPKRVLLLVTVALSSALTLLRACKTWGSTCALLEVSEEERDEGLGRGLHTGWSTSF